jgi:ubiquinol-cytochrome c reductase subunit 6
MKHHFEKCQEKVNAGEGYKGEDCVDEMCVSFLPSPTSD